MDGHVNLKLENIVHPLLLQEGTVFLINREIKGTKLLITQVFTKA